MKSRLHDWEMVATDRGYQDDRSVNPDDVDGEEKGIHSKIGARHEIIIDVSNSLRS